MLLTRKIGSVLRGKATPFQVLLATVLGGTLGFVPGFFLPGDLGGGFLQAPGLILLLACAVLVLNANLAMFGLVVLVAKLLSVALLPLSYQLGVFLLDGPLQGLFRVLVNGKGTAWFGFEYYATTGGLVLGALFGTGVGLLVNRAIRAIRTRMADAEEHSDRYRTYASKWWVRLLSWLFLGKGKGKRSWKELTEQKKVGLPIRITGVVAAAILVFSLWVFQAWFSTPILTQNTRAGLQAINGATVDLETAQLDFGSGTLQLRQLAIADSRALDRDLLAADELTAKIDTGELLRKRFVVDELISTSARAGTPRAVPGVRVESEAEPEPPPPPAPTGTKTVEDYLKDFEQWRARFEQVREWVDVLTGGDEPPPSEETAEQRAEDRAEQARVHGLASVVATHLFEHGPRVLIRKVDIEGIAFSIDGRDDRLALRLRNVSDRPSLVAGTMSANVASQSDWFRFALEGASTSGQAMGFQFAYTGLPVDDVFGQLRIGGAPPLRGGTIDLEADGALQDVAGTPMTLALPLRVTLQDTVFALAGAKETKVDSLLLPIGVRGPLTRPAIELDDKVLQEALLAAGQRELANFVQGQAGKLLGELPSGVRDLVDPDKAPQEQLDAVKRKAEEEAQRLRDEAARKAAEEAKKRLPGGLKGLFGGDEKKDPKQEDGR